MVQIGTNSVWTKLYSMVGQSVHICAHEVPLGVSCREIHLWESTKIYFVYSISIFECVACEASHWCFHNDYLFAGTSTPPGISATAVPSLAAPIGVNGFSTLPPQSNGQPTSEPIYTNGIHPYPGEQIKVYIRNMRYNCNETAALTLTLRISCLYSWWSMNIWLVLCYTGSEKEHHLIATMQVQHVGSDTLIYVTWYCLKVDKSPFYFTLLLHLFLIWTEAFKAWGSINSVFGRFLSSQP